MNNIFEDFTIAMVQPSRYGELLKRKKSALVLFIIILVSVTSLANVVFPSVTVSRMVKEYYACDVPYFKVEDGKMSVEKEYELKEGPFYFCMTNNKKFQKKDADGYDMVLLADEDKVIAKNYSGTYSFNFKDLGYDSKFDKNSIYAYKNIFINIMIVSDIILFILSFGVFLLGALIVLLLTKTFLKAMKLNLSFKEHFKIAIYSRTVPALLCALLSLINANVFYLMNLMVSVVYVYVVFINMKKQNEITDGEKENEDI